VFGESVSILGFFMKIAANVPLWLRENGTVYAINPSSFMFRRCHGIGLPVSRSGQSPRVVGNYSVEKTTIPNNPP
jgi:hypothetical protein